MVGQPDVAAAGGDRLEHVDVGAEDLRLVGHPGAQQLLRVGRAVLGDPVGDEGLVVLVVGGAQAELAAEAAGRRGPRSVLIASSATRSVERIGVRMRRLSPHHSLVGVAQLRAAPGPRAPAVETGSQQPGLLGAPEVREVGRDEQVGGRLGALAAQALEQLGRACRRAARASCRSCSSQAVNAASSPYCERPL